MNVEIDDLRFRQPTGFQLAVETLTFPAGTTTAIFGKNGSGKSTLLQLIAGVRSPAAGEIRMDGRPRRDGDVAIAFQDAIFLRGSVRENLSLALRLRGVAAREWPARIAPLAERLSLGELLDRPPARLSGGERQRANLARALCLRAPVTLLDEPLSAVDGPARERLQEELPELIREVAGTTIVVTHDHEEAFRLADRVVVLVDGTVRAAGDKAVVHAAPADADVASLLGYTVLRDRGTAVAVPRDGFTLGPAPHTAALQVRRTVDVGAYREVVGTIGDAMVRVRLEHGVVAPESGAITEVGIIGGVELAETREPPR